MKRIEYVIAGLLVFIGLACLTMSGAYFTGGNMDAYIKTFLQLCVWLGVPIGLIGVIYLMVIGKEKGKNND